MNSSLRTRCSYEWGCRGREGAKKHGQTAEPVGGEKSHGLVSWSWNPSPGTTLTPHMSCEYQMAERALSGHCHYIWSDGLGWGLSQGSSCPRHSPHRIYRRAWKGPQINSAGFFWAAFPWRNKESREQCLSTCLPASGFFLLRILVELGDCGKVCYHKHLGRIRNWVQENQKNRRAVLLQGHFLFKQLLFIH